MPVPIGDAGFMSWLPMAHSCQNRSCAKTIVVTRLILRPTGCFFAFVHDRVRHDKNMTTGHFCDAAEQLTSRFEFEPTVVEAEHRSRVLIAEPRTR